MQIIVIGAGAAGLAAAYTLSCKGFDPIVFEAKDRVGGRVYSCPTHGYTLDLGVQVVYSTYKTVFALCRELGIAHELIPFKPITDILRDSQRIRQFAILDTWGKRLSIARLQLSLLRWGNRLDLHCPERMPPQLAQQSFAEYVAMYHGQELLRDLFQPFTASLVHDRPEQIAAGVGLAYVRCALGKTYTLRSGIGLLAAKLGERIRQLHLNVPVISVNLENNRVASVTIRQQGVEQVIACDSVVVAVPAAIAASIIPNLPAACQTFLNSVPYSQCVHGIYGLPHPLLDDAYAIVIPSQSGLRIACLLEDANKLSDIVPKGAGLLHALTSGAASRELIALPDEQIIATLTQDIRKVLPQFPDAPLFCQVQRWHHSVCLFGPGYGQKLKEFQAQVQGIQGLHFAGDFIKIPSLEGALRSGQEVAEKIGKMLNY
jgi:protoporphyrinogen oxidase